MQTKMQTKLTSIDNVDIRKYPEQIDIDPSKTDNTIGDLHANALLLLHILVYKGIVTISPEDYQAFVNIYTREDLQPTIRGLYSSSPAPIFSEPVNYEELEKIYSEFNKIVSNNEKEKKITVIDKETLFRIIGDEVVDRGVSDDFMMLLIELLHKQNANFEILTSNHGIELVEACEKFKANGSKLVAPRINLVAHGNSMIALQESIKAGAIKGERIVDIYNESYKKHLKIVSYSLNAEANQIEIFSHAAIGFNHIKGLAKKFGVPYSAENAADEAKTIDRINEKYAAFVDANQVHTLYSDDMMRRGYEQKPLNDDDEVIAAVVWNREYHNLDRETDKFKVKFTHGHDSNDPNKENHLTLNELLGHFVKYVGTLKVYATNGQQAAPQSKKQPHQLSQILDLPKPSDPIEFHADESLSNDLNSSQIHALNDFQNDLNSSQIHDLDDEQFQPDSSEFHAANESDLSESALDVPLFEITHSPLGKRSCGVKTPNLNESQDLSRSSIGVDPFDSSTPTQSDLENPLSDSIFSTLGDAQKFYPKRVATQNQQEEMDPSFLFDCCSKFTGAEIIGYTLIIGLLAIAITALCFATYGVAAAAVAAAPLAVSLMFFSSNKGKDRFDDSEPENCLCFD